MNPTPLLIGLDIGTSVAKAAAFRPDGERIASVESVLPPLVEEGGAVEQDIDEIVEAVHQVLANLRSDTDAPWRLLALTTQRDTLLLLDSQGSPVTRLISWRDRRGLGYPSFWDGLAAEDPELLRGVCGVRSLTSELSRSLTGITAETWSTLPTALQGGPLERLQHLRQCDRVELPAVGPVGGAVGDWQGVPVHLTAGDKNCELLGKGVHALGRASLSLGSAISLGMTRLDALEPSFDQNAEKDLVYEDEPVPRPGVVFTRAAREGGWDVETGLVAGMDIGSRLGQLGISFSGGRPSDGELVDGDLWNYAWCLPYFRGALDRPTAEPLFYPAGTDTPSVDVFQIWAQGVLCELRRLRPMLEEEAGHPISEIRLGGGAVRSEGWLSLVANVLDVSVRITGGSWAGCRGAVCSALLVEPDEASEVFMRDFEEDLSEAVSPDPVQAEKANGYFERFADLVKEQFGRLDR